MAGGARRSSNVGPDGAGGAHPADSDSAAGAWTAGYPQKETAPGGKIWGGLNLGRTGKASAQGATPGGAHPAVLRRTRMPAQAHPTACLPAPGAPELTRSDARQSPFAPSTPRGLLDNQCKPPCQWAGRLVCPGQPSVARCLVTGPSDDGCASAALYFERQSEEICSRGGPAPGLSYTVRRERQPCRPGGGRGGPGRARRGVPIRRVRVGALAPLVRCGL